MVNEKQIYSYFSEVDTDLCCPWFMWFGFGRFKDERGGREIKRVKKLRSSRTPIRKLSAIHVYFPP